MLIGIDAHYLESQPTGVGRYLISLLLEWNKFQLAPDLKFILYFRKEIPDDLNLSDSLFEKKLLKAPFGWPSNAFFIHYLLPRAAQKDKVDILFCPGYVAPVFPNFLQIFDLARKLRTRRLRRPKVTSSAEGRSEAKAGRGFKIALALHDIIYQARPDLYSWSSIFDRILLKKVSQLSAQRAKIIFTPSEFTRQEVLKHYQVDSNKVFNVPLAADESFKKISDQSQIAQIKRKYQIKDKFIFYVGSIFNRRHLPETIEAFGHLASKLSNYQFLIIGVNHTSPFVDIGGLIEQANQKLRRQAVLHQTYLSGQDLVTLYNAADLLIWLSDYEGFGLPVLEAMTCGIPVVTSPLTSIPEVAGQAAIYVQDSKNIEEICQAIERGLTNQSLRQNLISRGLEQAKKFSWPRCAQETLQTLRFKV